MESEFWKEEYTNTMRLHVAAGMRIQDLYRGVRSCTEEEHTNTMRIPLLSDIMMSALEDLQTM